MLFIVFLCSISLATQAQSTHDVMFSGGFDLLKTDIRSLLSKAQVGFEGHYFVERHFAVGVGTELWANSQKSSFMMGARWYADDHFFLRFRGLIGVNDASFGVGYAKPIDKNFRAEGMGDYYFGGAAFAFRIGVSYVLK